jgi:hypothetical protein
MIAITSHFQPMTLRVRPGQPVTTDPKCDDRLVWKSHAGVQEGYLSEDASLAEEAVNPFRCCFKGDGFVVVQPYEEVYFQGQLVLWQGSEKGSGTNSQMARRVLLVPDPFSESKKKRLSHPHGSLSLFKFFDLSVFEFKQTQAGHFSPTEHDGQECPLDLEMQPLLRN